MESFVGIEYFWDNIMVINVQKYLQKLLTWVKKVEIFLLSSRWISNFSTFKISKESSYQIQEKV